MVAKESKQTEKHDNTDNDDNAEMSFLIEHKVAHMHLHGVIHDLSSVKVGKLSALRADHMHLSKEDGNACESSVETD